MGRVSEAWDYVTRQSPLNWEERDMRYTRIYEWEELKRLRRDWLRREAENGKAKETR